jgi:hypothetical protein
LISSSEPGFQSPKPVNPTRDLPECTPEVNKPRSRSRRLSRITEADPLQVMALQMEPGGALEWLTEPNDERKKEVREKVSKARVERSRANAKKYAVANSQRSLARYYELRKDPEHRKMLSRRALAYAERKPLAARAHEAIKNQIRSGAMRPARECSCVDCGKPATDYDHRDYNKPLEVEPTCRSCNLLRGPALPYLGEV